MPDTPGFVCIGAANLDRKVRLVLLAQVVAADQLAQPVQPDLLVPKDLLVQVVPH